MVDTKYNGSNYCPVGADWKEHREEAKKCMQQVDTMHESVMEMLEHTRHLDKLDKLERLEKLELIATGVNEMKDKLVAVVIGKDQIPTEAFDKMISEIKQVRISTFRLMFIVIFSLLAILIFLLTGEHFDWIRVLH